MPSVSQTPDTHADVAAAGVHIPLSVGVWPGTMGIGWPLTTLGTHVNVGVLQ